MSVTGHWPPGCDLAQGSGGTAGLWDHSPGFQFWPRGAPRETHASTKGEDDFQREGVFTGALQCRPQPTEPRPASPGCQAAGAPGVNLREVATVFTRANRCLVCNPSQAQMELPSQLQQLQVECGKKTLLCNNFTVCAKNRKNDQTL